MPVDTFTDLDTVAGHGDGSLWRWRDGNVWAAKGAQPDGSGGNLRLPAASVGDARVRAALAAGAWVPSWIDGTPPTPIAIVKAPVEGEAPIRARTLAEFGVAA